MHFDPGIKIEPRSGELGFDFGPDVIGPSPEFRTLDAIRPSLRDPQCGGPDPVYAIAMDVAKRKDIAILQERMLLFGVVAYEAGRLGKEPVRSQGHVHAISPHNGWSAPEWFEVWEGTAIIYAQQFAGDDPGVCVAVTASPGEQVVVPPGWAHCVVNANPEQRMVFGALCDRQYGFVYDAVRRHHGLAWFPLLTVDNRIVWEANANYLPSTLTSRKARTYPELGCRPGMSMYQQFEEDPDSVNWVSRPEAVLGVWDAFIP